MTTRQRGDFNGVIMDSFGGETDLAAGVVSVYTSPATGASPVVVLHCVAYGGIYGGRVSVALNGAGRDAAYTNWFAGTLTWKVPIGWRRVRRGEEGLLSTRNIDYALYDDKESRPLLIGGREDAYTQTFEIELDGTSSIRKFGYKLERSRWLPFGSITQIGED